MSLWLSAAVSVAGALLAFVGARLGVRAELVSIRQRERQGRREEWGRRFATALSLLADSSDRRQVIGKELISELLHSELATSSEKRLTRRIFALDLDQLAGTDPSGAVPGPLDNR